MVFIEKRGARLILEYYPNSRGNTNWIIEDLEVVWMPR